MWFFRWLREQVKLAIMGGFQDAADELELAEPALRERLKMPPLALPPAAEAGPAEGDKPAGKRGGGREK